MSPANVVVGSTTVAFGLLFVYVCTGLLFALRGLKIARVGSFDAGWSGAARTGVLVGFVTWSASLLAIFIARRGLGDVFEFAPALLALAIALLGCSYGILIIRRTSFQSAPLLGGIAIGFAIAVCHFTAMVAYHPAAPYAWNIDVIMLALALAVVVSALGLRLVVVSSFPRSFEFGCAAIAFAVVAMSWIALEAVLPINSAIS
ncbi:MHYT domain-containing protein [Agrobacterium sp. 22-222-1]